MFEYCTVLLVLYYIFFKGGIRNGGQGDPSKTKNPNQNESDEDRF